MRNKDKLGGERERKRAPQKENDSGRRCSTQHYTAGPKTRRRNEAIRK
jgi:hypothetical protein